MLVADWLVACYYRDMDIITNDKAADLIRNSNGKVFSVTFVKRSDGTLRQGRFRFGPSVNVGRVGGSAPYDFGSKRLIPVYRMAGDSSESDGKRRTIPIEGITKLTIEGKEYKVA